MGRKWKLNGPDQDVLWFDEVARLFGYTSKYLRDLISVGHVPSPRGEGKSQYYTGDDLAAIYLLLGRWRPAENVPKEAESVGRRRISADDGQS